MHNLGQTLSEQKKWQEAKELQSHLVGLPQHILGMDHEHTIKRMMNLATTLLRCGQSSPAESLVQDALNVW